MKFISFLWKAFLDLFFPKEGPPRIFFSISSRPPPRSKFFFSLTKICLNFFHLFFPGESLLKFIYFPGNAFLDLFFPKEGPPRFFFLNFLQASPQIINGRPIMNTRTISGLSGFLSCKLCSSFGKFMKSLIPSLFIFRH